MQRQRKAYQNTCIVIAGGASGIGEQIVRQVAPYARKVIVLDRNIEAGEALVASLGAHAEYIALNMNDGRQVEKAITKIHQGDGQIDYFFNCAGSFMAGEIRDSAAEQWQAIMHENIDPIATAISSVYAVLRKQASGHIVTVASSAGLFPVPIMSLYGSAKSAVVLAMLGLRMEAKNFNVKVSVVCPTVVDTPLYDRATYAGLEKETALTYLRSRKGVQTPDKAAQQILKKVPKNRAVIHTAQSTYWAWVLYRISPALYMKFAARIFTPYRQRLRKESETP